MSDRSVAEGALRRVPRELKDRLIKAVREVDIDRLPAIASPQRPPP